jgi:outer membrane protein OmpA-like peptidoglycan-associated protein
MAEHHIELLDPFYTDEPLGEEHGLRFEFELVRQQLAVLVLEGADLCFPATVIEAKNFEARIAREIYGDMLFDATNDVIVLRHLLHRLERQLDYALQYETCQLPKLAQHNVEIDIETSAQEEVVETIIKEETIISEPARNQEDDFAQILLLLNADNQFATNSSEVNLKYVARLAQAVQIIQHYPQLQLHVVGATDELGNTEKNMALGQARADGVARYLEAFGISMDRISVMTSGEGNPLFPGDAPHIRLTNRRVNITISLKDNNTPEQEDL